MATAHKIREGSFLILWNHFSFSRNWMDKLSKATVNIEEMSLTCQLSFRYASDFSNKLFIEFQPLSTKNKNPDILEPSSVMASHFGEQQQSMTLQNAKWTTRFYIGHLWGKLAMSYGPKTFTFEIVIDFMPKPVLLIKAHSQRVLDHLSNLWETKTMADVTFKFEENQMQAHSLILASGSPVLAAMFQNDFKEKQERIVEIKDAEPSVFEKLLCFIYTGDVDLDNVERTDLFILADKYGVDSLKEECALRLVKDLTVENAIQILVLSHLHTSTNLYQSALDFISKNDYAIFSREEWMEVKKSYPELGFAAMQLMVKKNKK